MQLLFAKYEGLGNDFIVVDGRKQTIVSELFDTRRAIALCDRRRGIGADGILVIQPSQIADAKMDIINSDGSQPEMCGNGIRCVARFLYEADEACTAEAHRSSRSRIFRIETQAGVMRCELALSDVGQVQSVAVDMGTAVVLPTPKTLMIGNETIHGIALNLGNPHYCVLTTDASLLQNQNLQQLARRLGPAIESHEAFSDRTNVGFARLAIPGPDIEAVVWERGCGLTLACGTGACAIAAVAVHLGHRQDGVALPVHLPGGELRITVEENLKLRMQGPAAFVFSGELT